jgi:hypothetical protein
VAVRGYAISACPATAATGETHWPKNQFSIILLSQPFRLVLVSPPEALSSTNNIAEAHRSYYEEADDANDIEIWRVAIPRVFLVDLGR